MDISREMNIKGYSSILASILYYLRTINCNMCPEDLVRKISDDFWLDNGFMSSNMNRPKMVFDLCDKYHIENHGYDDIFSHMRELFRPDDEISKVADILHKNDPRKL